MDSTAVLGERTKPSPKAFLPWIAVFLFGVGVGALLYWLILVRPSAEIMNKSLVMKPAGEARLAVLLLENLRKGDTQPVIDTLQLQLEGNVVALGVSLGVVEGAPKATLDPESATYIRHTLQSVAAYFDEFPRTPLTDPAFARGEQAIQKTLASVASTEGGQSAP